MWEHVVEKGSSHSSGRMQGPAHWVWLRTVTLNPWMVVSSSRAKPVLSWSALSWPGCP